MKISVLTITARDHTGFESLVRSCRKQFQNCKPKVVNWSWFGFTETLETNRPCTHKRCLRLRELISHSLTTNRFTMDRALAGARNAGVRACTGDWIVSIDDLTVFQDHALLYHLSFARMGVDACVGTFDVQKDDGSVVPCFEADSRMKILDVLMGDGLRNISMECIWHSQRRRG